MRIVVALIGWLNRIVPKRSAAVISTLPTPDDNGLALVPRLQDKVGTVTWLTSSIYDSPGAAFIPGAVKTLPHTSVRGIWAYLRAHYVFFTHGLYRNPAPPSSQIVVNLWHGMPVKRLTGEDGNTTYRSSYAVATSPLFQKILAKSFNLPLERVLVTGQPRTDRLFNTSPQRVIERIAHNSQLGLTRLFLWLPTYRASDVGDIRAIVL